MPYVTACTSPNINSHPSLQGPRPTQHVVISSLSRLQTRPATIGKQNANQREADSGGRLRRNIPFSSQAQPPPAFPPSLPTPPPISTST
ncbi:hypothetical protein E2C01_001405 [Portunus trituberculatus]|uniref:Uncharacterized protein n=1 Tax=Portunus trituberculatus TaxID=210409 RepID=A0A5B7CGL7_PORTR|nr:hypothetical protein [Portunus trituberculatus]